MNAPLTRRRALRHFVVAGSSLAVSPLTRSAETPRTLPEAARRRPKVIAFDVIETLFDPASVDAAMVGIGLPVGSLKIWFPRFLRDAFSLEVIGEFKPFREVATGSLAALCREFKVAGTESDIDSVLKTFATLPPHPEVKAAFEFVHAGGVPMITLTNGSAAVTRKMLEGASLAEFIERVISIDEVQHWKPAKAVYHYAAKAMQVDPDEMALVAAHDWDTAGALRAGLTSVGVDRQQRFSAALPPPHITGASVLEAVKALLALPA